MWCHAQIYRNMRYKNMHENRGSYLPGENEDKDTRYHYAVMKICSAHVVHGDKQQSIL